jgi:hypothetical protein
MHRDLNDWGWGQRQGALGRSPLGLCRLHMGLLLLGVLAVMLPARAVAGSGVAADVGGDAGGGGGAGANVVVNAVAAASETPASVVLPSEALASQPRPEPESIQPLVQSLPEPSGADRVSAPAAAPVVAELMLSYSLREGEPVDRQLADWAKREGWSLRWRVPVTWEVFSSFDVVAAGSRQAIESAVQALRQDGAPIRMHVFSNRVIVIESSAISQGAVAP